MPRQISLVADQLDSSRPINYRMVCWRLSIRRGWSEYAHPDRLLLTLPGLLDHPQLTPLSLRSPRLTVARASSGRRRSPARSRCAGWHDLHSPLAYLRNVHKPAWIQTKPNFANQAQSKPKRIKLNYINPKQEKPKTKKKKDASRATQNGRIFIMMG